jgi:hypothetical protein
VVADHCCGVVRDWDETCREVIDKKTFVSVTANSIFVLIIE